MVTATERETADRRSGIAEDEDVLVDVRGLTRRFGPKTALRDVSFEVRAYEIHALLGPNGAGKTTLLRTISGLIEPSEGTVEVNGLPWAMLAERHARAFLGLAPSGDRSFYLRLSALENLAFFGRLQGLARKASVERAVECLGEVGLDRVRDQVVGTFSHGMQKRLSFARALLMRPPVLLIDEATHDLDPPGARTIQHLASEQAAQGSAVLWATQRVDEIRGFADRVTLLHEGAVRFSGSVPALMAHSLSRAYVLHLRTEGRSGDSIVRAVGGALDGMGKVQPADGTDGEYVHVSLEDHAVLGDAIAAITRAGVSVLACREERSEIELAFLKLTGEPG